MSKLQASGSSEAPVRPRQRYTSLDGLRGLAAVIVVIHHCFLLSPNFDTTYFTTLRPVTGSPLWWLSDTPLKLMTAGTEAVVIFFVLSGFVLTLPVLKRDNFDWRSYYPQRVTRLWLPVLASVVLAGIWIALAHQNIRKALGPWIAQNSTPHLKIQSLVDAADLFSGNFGINGPLWSLQWEMIFSLALPLFVGLALVLKRRWILGLAAIVVLTFIGIHFPSGTLTYLPTFLVGAMIATQLPRIRELCDRINTSRSRHLIWAIALFVACMLLISTWLIGPMPQRFEVVSQAARAIQPIAAGMIVIICLGWQPLATLFSTKPFQWAGKISFSLYLTHSPILIFARYAFPHLPLGAVIAIGLGIAIPVAILFYWLIESRAHKLSKRVGHAIGTRFTAHFATTQQPS